MRLMQKTYRHSKLVVRRNKAAHILHAAIEAIEARMMLTTTTGETVSTPISSFLATTSNSSNDSITLNQHFFDSSLPGTLVTFNTSEGEIQVGLTDAATPLTVANFLSYVESGAYNGTFFHRSAFLDGSGTPSASNPSNIIQAGGYNISNGMIAAIATNAPVQDEYTTELYGDVADTIAMAKTSLANSATSQFYFNVTDNTQALDTPTVDSNGVTTSYTVFGKVLSGDSVINTIAELPVYSIDPTALPDVPVTGITQAQASSGANLSASNLVFINSATAEPGTSYTVTSDDPALVTPTVNNSTGVLSFTYGANQSGTAEITVNATNLDGTSASTTFAVTVPNSANPGQGPVAQSFTSSSIVSGSQGVVQPLNYATDDVSPLPTDSVAIVTGPAHGTATVDSSTGHIDYTSTAGFVGNDTLTYTVTDAAGTTSSPATITLDVVPTAVKVTIGTASAGSLIFTQPDGAKGTLRVRGGTAVVTFTDYQVTTNQSGGVITASGEGATITDITITNARGANASLSLVSAQAVTLGSVNDAGRVTSIVAPNATLTGTSSVAALEFLNVAAANMGSLTIGGHFLDPTLLIPTATDFSLQTYNIGTLKSRQWLNTDSGSYKIYANSINFLDVTGTFAENLQLVGKGYNLVVAKVGAASGTWNLSGSILEAQLGSPASTWSLNAGGVIERLTVTGTLANTIVAAAVNTISVVGSTNGAVIETDANFSKKYVQIAHIKITGSFENSVIFAAGNIDAISAGSIVGSRIYAGINLSVAQAGGFANTASDLSNDARIQSIVVGAGTSSFSDSQINADILGAMELGDINTSNNGVPEGVAAHTITSIRATLNGQKKAPLVLTKTELASAAALAAYIAKEKITLTDLAIDLY
jgi:cyclophilin family peptidyl-prolyl cis-trans isomerase